MGKPSYFQAAQGVWGLKIVFVNIYMVSHRNGETHDWVLVDAGLPGSASSIVRMAEMLFGQGTKPAAIVLTHAHFDHTGALEELLKTWDVPVYAHPLEFAYLTGRSAYPPGDPTVGGGFMTLMSWAYPKGPIDIGTRVQPLTEGDKVPFLPEWRVLHTPGHSPGHISLFRESNATLIAGDAFVTTKNESLFYALTYKKHLSGPPKQFTPDWIASERSVKKLAALLPRIAATGHGRVMMGKELRLALNGLAADFKKEAVPLHGRYVDMPAVADESGVLYVPPFRTNMKFNAAVMIAGLLTGYLAARLVGKK